MELDGKKVVIIGGSSGTGLGTAKVAAANGAQVVIASRSQEKLAAAKAEIGGAVETKVVDATDQESVRQLFDVVGPFDHLATPGSETILGSVGELDLSQAQRAFEVKYWPQYLAAKHGAPKIREGGSIIFMAGSFSQRPQPMGSVQASINAAIEGLGRALAVELGPIRVNTVSPGMVDTPMWDDMPEDKRREMYTETAKRLPAGRIASSEEVGQAIVFLMANPHMTGTTLFIDGGEVLQ